MFAGTQTRLILQKGVIGLLPCPQNATKRKPIKRLNLVQKIALGSGICGLIIDMVSRPNRFNVHI